MQNHLQTCKGRPQNFTVRNIRLECLHIHTLWIYACEVDALAGEILLAPIADCQPIPSAWFAVCRLPATVHTTAHGQACRTLPGARPSDPQRVHTWQKKTSLLCPSGSPLKKSAKTCPADHTRQYRLSTHARQPGCARRAGPEMKSLQSLRPVHSSARSTARRRGRVARSTDARTA